MEDHSPRSRGPPISAASSSRRPNRNAAPWIPQEQGYDLISTVGDKASEDVAYNDSSSGECINAVPGLICAYGHPVQLRWPDIPHMPLLSLNPAGSPGPAESPRHGLLQYQGSPQDSIQNQLSEPHSSNRRDSPKPTGFNARRNARSHLGHDQIVPASSERLSDEQHEWVSTIHGTSQTSGQMQKDITQSGLPAHLIGVRTGVADEHSLHHDWPFLPETSLEVTPAPVAAKASLIGQRPPPPQDLEAFHTGIAPNNEQAMSVLSEGHSSANECHRVTGTPDIPITLWSGPTAAQFWSDQGGSLSGIGPQVEYRPPQTHGKTELEYDPLWRELNSQSNYPSTTSRTSKDGAATGRPLSEAFVLNLGPPSGAARFPGESKSPAVLSAGSNNGATANVLQAQTDSPRPETRRRKVLDTLGPSSPRNMRRRGRRKGPLDANSKSHAAKLKRFGGACTECRNKTHKRVRTLMLSHMITLTVCN